MVKDIFMEKSIFFNVVFLKVYIFLKRLIIFKVMLDEGIMYIYMFVFNCFSIIVY